MEVKDEKVTVNVILAPVTLSLMFLHLLSVGTSQPL